MSRRYFAAIAVAAVVVGLDLITKRYAAINFADRPVSVIDDFLSFTFVENPGAAFSMFQDGGVFFAVAAIVISVVILVSLRHERSGLEVVGFGLIIGGALGNLVDRIFRAESFLDGHVIDWINLSIIPTFNLADTAITCAVGVILIDAWRKR